MSSMSGLDLGLASSILLKERNSIALERGQSRFFQSQNAAEGGCAFRAFNNAIGKPLITTSIVRDAFEEEKLLFQNSLIHHPDPGKHRNLPSITLLERVARAHGYSLKRIGSGRSKQDKFNWILEQNVGRFVVLTYTDFAVHARDGHDLDARNYHHWIAISVDETLVIDSLARKFGPQPLSEQTLSRSVRDGILRIYAVQPRPKKQ